MLRGAASTGFRAPSLGQSFFSTVSTNFTLVGGTFVPAGGGHRARGQRAGAHPGRRRTSSRSSPSTSAPAWSGTPPRDLRPDRRPLPGPHRRPHRPLGQLHGRRTWPRSSRRSAPAARATSPTRWTRGPRASTCIASYHRDLASGRPLPAGRLQPDRHRRAAHRAHPARAGRDPGPERVRRPSSSTTPRCGASPAASPRTTCGWWRTGSAAALRAPGPAEPLRRVLQHRGPHRRRPSPRTSARLGDGPGPELHRAPLHGGGGQPEPLRRSSRTRTSLATSFNNSRDLRPQRPVRIQRAVPLREAGLPVLRRAVLLPSYVPILILGRVALGFAVFTLVVSQLLGRPRPNPAKSAVYECGVPRGRHRARALPRQVLPASA